MTSSWSNLVNNSPEIIHKNKCKFGHNNKNCKTCGTKYKNYEYCLEYTNIDNNLMEYKGLCCNKNHQNFKKIFAII